MENNIGIKKIPQEPDSEAAILGSILIDPEITSQVIDEIDIDDFYDSRNRLIYDAIETLSKESISIDVTSVVSMLEKKDNLDKVGGIDYLSSLATFNYSSANIETYISIVKNASLKRQTIQSLKGLVEKGYDQQINANDYLTLAEEQIFDLSKNRQTSSFIKIDEVAEIVRDKTEKNANQSSEVVGLNTGYDNFNRISQGLQNGALYVLAARPGMGKSAFALSLAQKVATCNLSKDNVSHATVAFFSLEMGPDELVLRMLANEAIIPLGDLKKGNLDDKGWRSFGSAQQKLSQLNIYFSDNADITVEDIRAKCRKLAQDRGLDLVVIDYLQLISDRVETVEYAKISKISRLLKLMARELDIPVIALAQLSRDVEKRDEKVPQPSDLRGSGTIEQDADMILFLYREEMYHKGKRPGECDLIIAKNRSGATGTLHFMFEGMYQKFTEKMEENS
jgi:replicative DNA helicase